MGIEVGCEQPPRIYDILASRRLRALKYLIGSGVKRPPVRLP
jgi:hypothetical protein